MNVHQLSIAYAPEQDRILARINTREGRELQCWLTRRLTLGVSPLIERLVTEQMAVRGGLSAVHLAALDPLAKKEVANFHATEALKNADFSTPYKAPEASAPLFDTPLLVTDVHVSTLGNGQLRLSFVERLQGAAGERSFQMALADEMVQAFVHLLERAIQQSQWRDGTAGVAGPVAPGGPLDKVEKPEYLN